MREGAKLREGGGETTTRGRYTVAVVRLVRFIVLAAVWGSVLALLARVMLADMGWRTGVLVWVCSIVLARCGLRLSGDRRIRR
jgi:hypothetical protein